MKSETHDYVPDTNLTTETTGSQNGAASRVENDRPRNLRVSSQLPDHFPSADVEHTNDQIGAASRQLRPEHTIKNGFQEPPRTEVQNFLFHEF